MPLVRSKGPRRVAGLLVVCAAVLLAAACGGGSGAGAGNGGGAGEGNNALAAYTDCMKKNGVTITMPSGGPRARPSAGPGAFPSGAPRPSGGAGRGGFPGGGEAGRPEGVDDATWQKAQAACASLRPNFGPGNRGGGGNGANQAYMTCLRDHGVTQGQAMGTSDPTVAKALEACKVLRPTASPTPTS